MSQNICHEKIKLILLDLDGTLLTTDKKISAANYSALEQAAAKGIYIVPCTGRFFSGMPENVRNLPFLHYAITINGAQVEDLQIVEGKDYCTLFTCTPYGINTHRLLVRGIRIETITEKPVIYVANEAFRIEPLLVTPAVAAPMVLVFLIHLMVKYREPPKKKEGESNHGT